MKNKHQQANIYKELCSQAENVINNKNYNLPSGWEKESIFEDDRSNYKHVLYRNGNETILCFVGTEKPNIKDWSSFVDCAKDWGANFKMGVGKISKQMDLAEDNCKKLLEEYPDLKVIGHSEGGTETTYVATKFGIPAVTFNAFGLGKKFLGQGKKPEDFKDLVTNYRDPHDPVSKLKENVGETYIVDSTQNKFMKITPLGSVQAHASVKMGNCETAIPKEDYKKKHKGFIDKISEAEIPREDISELSPELFDVYYTELASRMSEGIPTREDAKNLSASGGLVHVSAYTRDDGTEVSEYYRKLPV